METALITAFATFGVVWILFYTSFVKSYFSLFNLGRFAKSGSVIELIDFYEKGTFPNLVSYLDVNWKPKTRFGVWLKSLLLCPFCFGFFVNLLFCLIYANWLVVFPSLGIFYVLLISCTKIKD